jgi:Fe-S cluster biogenesis protein NfuA
MKKIDNSLKVDLSGEALAKTEGYESQNKKLFNIVNSAIDEVRDFIKSDGGDIELIKIEDNKVYVKLKGNCVGCPLSVVTLKMGVLEAVKEKVPEIVDVVQVDI